MVRQSEVEKSWSKILLFITIVELEMLVLKFQLQVFSLQVLIMENKIKLKELESGNALHQ